MDTERTQETHPTFHDLPPELVERVANNIVDPYDCLHFASVCRAFRACSNPAMNRHREMSRQHRAINAGTRQGQLRVGALLAQFAGAQRTGLYVRNLTLSGWDDPSDLTEGNQSILEARYTHIFNSTVGHTRLGSIAQRRSWRKALERNDHSVLAGLLLLILPNLQRLIWQADNVARTKVLPSIIGAVARQKGTTYLSRLKKVILQRTPGDESIPSEYIKAFLKLGSLRSIRFKRVMWSRARPLPCGHSSVREIKVSDNDQGWPHQSWLEELCAAPTTLESFAFCWPEGLLFSPISIHDALLRRARNTLRRLTIRGGGIHDRGLAGLGHFTALAYVDLDFSILLEEHDSSTIQYAGTILPFTLEHLKLHDDDQTSLYDASELLCELLDFREAAFPRFSRLEVFLDPYLDEEDGVTAFNECQAADDLISAKCAQKHINYTAHFVENAMNLP